MDTEPADFPTPNRQWRGDPSVWLLVLFGLVAPAALVLIYVHRFGVNIPAHDEWNFMPTLEAFYQGHGWPHFLIEHYGEHRIPLPKAIILLLTPFTKLNVKVEMYLSATLMLGTALALTWLIQKTTAPRWLILPVGWLVVSTGQYENLLVGWQFQIPLMNFFAVVTICFLTSERRVARYIAAPISALSATFSFANGLMLWPATILFSLVKRRIHEAALWGVLGSLAVWVYQAGYHGYRRTPTDRSPDYLFTLLNDPMGVVQLFLGSVGNNFGAGRVGESIAAGAVLLTLTAVLAFSAATKEWQLRSGQSTRPTMSGPRFDPWPWLCLMSFSFLSAGAIAIGRSMTWREFITPSRYLTVTIFIPVGLLVLSAVYFRLCRFGRGTIWAGLIAVLLLGAGAWQHLRTVEVGWVIGRADHDQKIRVRECVIRYRDASDDCLRLIYAPNARWVRRYACALERWKLGPFAGTQASMREEHVDCEQTASLDGPRSTRPSPGATQGPSATAKFAVVWVSNDAPARMRRGTTALVHVVAKNAGDWTWPDPKMAQPLNPDGSYAVRLSYRWVKQGSSQEQVPVRINLPASVPPGQTTTFTFELVAEEPGSHRLEFDLVIELVTWFSDKGTEKLSIPVLVE